MGFSKTIILYFESKASTDDKTLDNARIIRKQVQQNPNLKSLLIGSFKIHALKKSLKIQRSPQGKQGTLNENKQNKGLMNKNTRTNLKVLATIINKNEGKTR
ncbi:hypothetical protein TSAR_002766 [Trichomalopsis sarcophagae]|uniref:Uncharacterized protein n=1 Tax=Trichomalopsis sarcophagae TaxID=543379 RepID=A0A232EYV5_9HYME|nr:hypothetical protein TSAR_002766 [Trichomalopsis sarcophagae]